MSSCPSPGSECLERRRGLLAETGQDRQADNASVPRRCYASASGRDTQHWLAHLCSRCHRDHGRAKTLRMTLAPSSRKRLAVPDVPFSRNLSPSTLDEAQQAVNVRRLCQAGADVSHTFSPPASRSPKRHAVFVAPSAVRKRERSALSGLAPGEPFPLRIPSCNSSSGG